MPDHCEEHCDPAIWRFDTLRLCKHCKAPYHPSREEYDELVNAYGLESFAAHNMKNYSEDLNILKMFFNYESVPSSLLASSAHSGSSLSGASVEISSTLAGFVEASTRPSDNIPSKVEPV